MTDNQNPLVRLELQLTDQEFNIIEIKDDDDIEIIIEEYCKDKGFNTRIKDFIMEQIVVKMDENINLLESKDHNKTSNTHTNVNRLLNETEHSFSSKHTTRTNFNKMQGEISGISEIEQKTNKSKNKVSKTKNHHIYTEEKEELSKIPIGDRLYNNHFKKNKKKQEHIEKLQNIKLKKEMEGVTFTPEISSKSRDLTIINDNALIHEPIEDRLIKQGLEMKTKMEKDSMLKKIKEYDFSFKPILNDKSLEMADNVKRKRIEDLTKAGFNLSKDKKSKDINKKNSDSMTKSAIENHIDSREEFAYVRKRQNNAFHQSEKTLKTKISRNISNLDNSINNNEKHKVNNAKSGTDQTDVSLLQPPKYKEFLTTMRNEYRGENNRRPNFPRLANAPTTSSIAKSKTNSKSLSKVSKDSINNIHDELYYNGKLIQDKEIKKINEYREKVYPFTPKLYKPHFINAFKVSENQSEFTERLINSKKITDEELLHKERVAANLLPTFKPTINKYESRSKSGKRYANENFDDFYSERLIKNQTKLEAREEQIKDQQHDIWKNECLKKIAKIKILKAKEIFEKLDSDKDKKISMKKIRFAGIDDDLLKKIMPVLNELEEGKEMDFKEFYYSIYAKLNI